MKLVDTDAPDHDEEPPVRVTPPRPEKRRAAVSLLFTLIVLAGTVIAVFTIFPERHNQILTDTVGAHRRPGTWELDRPDDRALRVWAIGVTGEEAPVPTADATRVAIGARTLSILNRRGVLVRYQVAGGEVTYFVQRSRDLLRRRVHRVDGGEAIEAWQTGPWTCVAIGPAASADEWRPLLGVPP